MPLNATWHAKHPMPENAPLEERVRWHGEHARECGCRKPPPDIAARLAEQEDEQPTAPRPPQRWSRNGPAHPRARPFNR